MENQLDKLSVGESNKVESIEMFYKLFSPDINKMTKKSFKKYPTKKATGKTVLGQSQDGRQVQVMIGEDMNVQSFKSGVKMTHVSLRLFKEYKLR